MAEQQQEPVQQTTSNYSCGFNLGLMDAALSACGGVGLPPDDSTAAGTSCADKDTGNGDVAAGMVGLSLTSSTAAAATDNGVAANNVQKNNSDELNINDELTHQQSRQEIKSDQQHITMAAGNWRKDVVDFAKRCTLRRFDDEDELIAEETEEAITDTPKNGAAPTNTDTKPAPSKNTKVKRKSSTLGALSSPFASSLRSSSSKSSSIKSTKKEIPNDPIPPNTWSSVSASKFSVRTGPNYLSTGRKLPSLESLYEVVAVRMYTSSCKTGEIGETLPLPPDILDGMGTKRIDPYSGIPDVLIVHVQMPHDAPSMFQPSTDGPGTECVIYLRPTQRFNAEACGVASIAPAARLFIKWCNEAAIDEKMRGRFKCMALVRNLEAHNLGWVAPYNGKPVLITESGRCRGGELPGNIRYLEMTANVHQWGYLAKKGFVSLLPKFRELRLDIGFTIEGRSDDELPECLLGCFAANFCDEGTLERMPDELLK